MALEPGDALCTLHRDLGAILGVYLDPARTFPGLGFGEPDDRRPEPEAILRRLACQLLGKERGSPKGWSARSTTAISPPSTASCTSA